MGPKTDKKKGKQNLDDTRLKMSQDRQVLYNSQNSQINTNVNNQGQTETQNYNNYNTGIHYTQSQDRDQLRMLGAQNSGNVPLSMQIDTNCNNGSVPLGMQTNPAQVLPFGTSSSYGQVNQPVQYSGSFQHNSPGINFDTGTPPWAANICNQLSNLQGMIESQNQKWMSVENKIESQNLRITKLENQLSKMMKLEQESSKVCANVMSLSDNVESMKSKISEYDSSIQHYSEMCDEITSNNTAIDRTLTNVTRKVQKLQEIQTDIGEKQEEMNEKMLDIQWRSMRENLIFSGIPEAGRDENCEETLQFFLENEMKLVGTFHFDRAHRLGKFNSTSRYPRPIVAKFTYYKDKEYVLQKAPNVLRNTNYYVREQFPPEIEHRRKELYPIAKEARKDSNNKVRLVRDKLYINNRQYRKGDYIPRAQNSQNIQRNSQTIEHRDTRSGRYENTRNGYTGQGYGTTTNTQSTRTFTRTQTRDLDKSNDASSFSLTNRFDVLSEETTPRRQPLAGKTKARSPLEDSDTFKKQREGSFGNDDSISVGDITSQDDTCDQPQSLAAAQPDTNSVLQDVAQ